MKPPAVIDRAIQAAIAAGEVGIQVAAYKNGEPVVDTWAGKVDEGSSRPVAGDTLFTVFSATKAVAAVAVHMQIARGALTLDSPVADVWPDFAANGKAGITVRHVLNHSAGVPQMPDGAGRAEMCDWEGMCTALAKLAPLWEPGTRHGYHAFTFGWLCGELVRRSDPLDRSFGQWVLDEICAPLGIWDLWLGIPNEVDHRVAGIIDIVMPEGVPLLPPDSLMNRAIPPHIATNRETFGAPEVRRSCHPGAGGIMNARALARLYAALAEGGALDEVTLLSPGAVESMATLQSDAVDEVIGRSYRRSLGFWLGNASDSNSAVLGPNPRAFGHPGAGGSIGWCDPNQRLAVAIVKNRMLAPATPHDNPVFHIAEAVRTALA